MKSFSLKYESAKKLSNFILLHKFKIEENCLVQVFSGQTNPKFLKELLVQLRSLLPNAHIIGATTDGEIQNKSVTLLGTVISFSCFEKVTLRSSYVDTNNSCEDAKTLYLKIGSDKTRLIIAFCDGINSNGETILNAFNDINQKMIVAGGLAGDNGRFDKTYVMHGDNVYERGLVGVALEGEDLEVNTHYNFDWVPIGREMEVTKSEENRVYEINGISACNIYKKYLGTNAAEKLPRIGVEFPLIIQDNGLNIARAIMQKHEDGSLSFAGNIKQGSQVRFGVGNPELILSHGHENTQTIKNFPVESVFIYSCMARRRFLQDNIESDLDLYPDTIPVSGFFTYGEFFSSGENKKLLNQSMTILMLSESKKLLDTKDVSKKVQELNEGPEYAETLESLAHLVNVTSYDLKQLNKNLEQRVEDKVKELEKSTKFFQNIFETAKEGIWVLDNEKETIMANNALVDILGFSEGELLGSSIYEFMDEKNIKKFQVGRDGSQYEVEFIHKEKNRVPCLVSTAVLSDENDEHIGSFVMVTNITQRKKAEDELISFNCLLEERIAQEVLKNHSKDELMSKQMRLAQMGEMISMIAHQWRQPLSTISAIITSMQLDLSLKDEEDTPLYQDMDKVTNHIQFLSDTIDDFRHFFNPKKSKDTVQITHLINSAIGIIKQSLIRENIDLICDFDSLERPMKLYSSELIQVFLNLMKNSMDALLEQDNAKSYISIRGSQYDDKSVLIFEDNGGGIVPDIMDKIFEPYFTTKDEKNGTGLGLYMSKMIIEEHCNGHLIVENIEVGTRFTIILDYEKV
ncbi:FIST C-terminal domain-containing protein [Sulfurimonas sp. MAG313]|nr:FIST N-terminal domain-containing protein [Sulfurimonas sp. MAG313]MDF1882069.1 FIST C-terminal domain-containing protein [Sulfurimonas sp. MAG313]